MRILAIRFARLGDVILLLPALASLKGKFPEATLTLLTGHRCAPIAELCPAIDEVLAVDRVAMRDGPILSAIRDIARLIREIRSRQFDLVVDFHSFRETNLLTWFSGAPVRIGMKRHDAPYLRFCFNRPPVLEDKSLHVSEMFQRVVNALPASAGAVCDRPIPASVLVTSQPAKARPAVLALYVDAPVPDRIWPPERFAEVADFAIEKLAAEVLVISSHLGAELARRLQKASRHAPELRLLTNLSLPELVNVIAGSQLLVSNDTGPMHIGPAVGVRTLGLFSVGYPENFRPIGLHDRFLRANPIEKIEVNEVIQAVGEMWITADRDLRC